MTAARQQRKSAAALGGALFLAFVAVPQGNSPVAATTEQVVVDPQRGLALSGFDPVAYFADAKPVLGREDMEYAFGGAIWRFSNEGNRAAFAEDPAVYAPGFGGHDPVAVARGVAVPGHPQIWAIIGDRLYLFYDSKARAVFSADPEGLTAAAKSRWPAVLHTLAP